ncbi:hypothetical protein BH11BAC2_BH11BAC2_17090 [soil metagenome]
MKYCFFLFCLVFVAACKKDNSSPADLPYIGFTFTGGLGPSPQQVTFTATAPDADEVTWDFGDSTYATGFTVSHTYSAYSCYEVKAIAHKGSQQGEVTQHVPVTVYKKVNLTSITFTQTPPLGPNGNDWDPNDAPDLKVIIKIGTDSIVDVPTVLPNSTTGTIYLPIPQLIRDLSAPITIEVYDKDAGSTPDLYKMGIVTFDFCQFIQTTVPYPNDGQVSNGSLRITLGFSWVL